MHPQAEQESDFLGTWGGVDGGSDLVVLACVLMATTKKSTFGGMKKSAPRVNPGYAYACVSLPDAPDTTNQLLK